MQGPEDPLQSPTLKVNCKRLNNLLLEKGFGSMVGQHIHFRSLFFLFLILILCVKLLQNLIYLIYFSNDVNECNFY